MSTENTRLRIAFVTADDSTKKKAWSGTPYYIAKALQKHCGDVYFIGPLQAGERKIARLIHEFYRHVLRKNFTYHHCFYLAKAYARLGEQALKHADMTFDLIFVPSNASQFAFLHTSLPIVFLQDATFALLAEYYPYYSNLAKVARRQGNVLDYLAIEKANLLIYTSEWAARSALEDYQAHPARVHVVPLGANLDDPPTRERALARKRSNHCQLLFIGVDWHRKGGDIAFETVLKLAEMGIDAELVVVGCVPPKQLTRTHMRVVPFLNKHDPMQYAQLEHLYLTSDFLLLPTRNEAYGIVFCEANAYGLPAIATDTGGVSQIIRNGENGFLLPLSARGDAYADVIASLYHDEQRYAGLVQTSRAAYDERLNWDVWGMSVKRLLEQMLYAQQASN